MIKKETLDFVKECVRVFDLGKPVTKPVLDGVQFVDRSGNSINTALFFSTGSVYIEHQGSPKSSIPEGFAQYRVPNHEHGEFRLDVAGNLVNTANTLYPAPQAPQLALKSMVSLLNSITNPAMSIKMLGNFVDSKYVYMEGRDIFCVREKGETQAAWMSAATDLPKALITPSAMTKAFVRLFSDKADDTVVSFISINGSYVAMQLYSAKLHIRVSHILATPSEKVVDIKFSIGKANLRIIRNEEELKLIKGEENMNLDQVSQLFATNSQPVAATEEPTTAGTVDKVEQEPEQVPAIISPADTTDTADKEETITPISEAETQEAAPPVTEVAQQPQQPEQTHVEIPLSELVANLITQLDQIKLTVVETTRGCKEAQKRIKKLEKNPPKTGLEERVKELETELAQEKALSLKRKKALDAALAG